ncbi:THUMP-like domain-containing protein [Formosa sp. S-31]|uniref:THUMP-like domain-containing protein n=1 Tax=Formosa sp. S-31 TaxID=2790949 RepID=UPI003EBF01D5
MNPSLLHPEIQRFINENLNSDITGILLKGTDFEGVETLEIIEQIEAKKRCKTKLPSWFQAKSIYYPNKLNIEQTSSELTAKHKASLLSGNTLIDITGGFGVDCFAFSKTFKKVTHSEINPNLSAIVKHNYKQLQVENIETIAKDGIEYLKTTKETYDWIYIDPSRRHDVKGKVFLLNDCLPNVPQQLDLLFSKSENILVKTSPLLDISIGLDELKYVKTIYTIALNNEVKELLWVLNKDTSQPLDIHAINITNTQTETFDFNFQNEINTEADTALPLNYLYEPNTAILKAGAFNSVATKLHCLKLHKHSHLYTSEQPITFPGRSFKILKVLAFNKKLLKQEAISKANITIRNFPGTVDDLRKKFKIKDGGNLYLFFTTNLNNEKVVIICEKA